MRLDLPFIIHNCLNVWMRLSAASDLRGAKAPPFFVSKGLLQTRMVPAIGLPIVAALTCYLFVFVQTYFALHCL